MPGKPQPTFLPESLECRRLLSATYRVIDLGTLGGDYSGGNGINARGHVAVSANASFDGPTHAVIYGAGKLTDLGTLTPTTEARAIAINDADVIAGYGGMPDGTEHAILQVGTKLKDIGTLGGENSYAVGINNAGTVVGVSDMPGGQMEHAFIYRNGKMRNLGTLGGDFSSASAINNSGQVVGYAALPTTPDGDRTVHAFIYSSGKMKDIGTLPHQLDSDAHAISGNGWIVGRSSTPSGAVRMFRYRNGRMTDLGKIGVGEGFANAVNDDGIVVGESLMADDYHAFVYRDGKLQDLNTLIAPNSGWTLEEASGINNLGKITGVGWIGNEAHAFLLIPGRIEGQVYQDTNANGRRDANESGLANVRVYIDIFGDGTYHAGDPTTLADSTGHYSFGSLKPGTYTVGVVPPKGFMTTIPHQGVQAVTLSLGGLRTGVRFGVRAV